MNKTRKLMTVALAAAALGGASALPALAEGVKQAQRISLQPGWNAVYIEVSPDETPDEIFSDWPVDWVARYDPAAFLETKQYSGTDSTEGAQKAGFAVWRRAEGPLSPLKRVSANCVYVCFSTNAATRGAYTKTLYGRPGAPRITWHPSSTNEPMNYVGFSVAVGKKTTLGEYFDGADIGNVTYQYLMQGGNPEKPSLVPVNVATELTNGAVVVMTSTRASNWSGVLNVSPMDGVDFSTNLTKSAVTVRNDSAKPRTVRLALGSGAAEPPADPPPMPIGLKWRDGASDTNAWQDFSASTPITRELAAGETFLLELALDRSQYGASQGAYYGALLHVDDVTTGGSNMRTTVPVEVTSDGGASAANAWPKGLWLCSGVFNQVNYMEETDESGTNGLPRAGGKAKVRLPLYVDNAGKMTLLQRVTYGVDSNGAVHVYSGALTDGYPVPIANVRCISSAVLPLDKPAVAAIDDSAFGALATFRFTVDEHSRVNPFYHAKHPMHDGLASDFQTPAPSGDNLENYVTSTVKPELFSITNRITFAWDETQGAAWSPQETCSGILTWELEGVRHEGTVRMRGAFSMRRISSATLDK